MYVGRVFSGGQDSSIERAECKATEGIWGTAAGTAEEIQRGDRGSAGTDITRRADTNKFSKNCTAW